MGKLKEAWNKPIQCKLKHIVYAGLYGYAIAWIVIIILALIGTYT